MQDTLPKITVQSSLNEDKMKLKKILSSLSIILALSAFGTFSFPDDSEGRRLGGGRSIGRTVAPKATPSTGSGFTQQQQRQNINQSQAAGTSSAMSRGGMFGGLFGGLLAGTLLGSLLMGGGFAGVGLFDILLIGLVIFMVSRFFRARQNNNQNNQHSQNYQSTQNTWNKPQSSNSGSAWDRLRSDEQGFEQENNNTANSYDAESSNSNVAGINIEEFIAGAKTLYLRMQSSWDERDLEDIKQFTSPELFAEIETQFKEEPTPTKTEILLVDASYMDRMEDGDKEYVSVIFDVLMREDQSAQNSSQVREIWTFVKELNSKQMWTLAGIQQV